VNRRLIMAGIFGVVCGVVCVVIVVWKPPPGTWWATRPVDVFAGVLIGFSLFACLANLGYWYLDRLFPDDQVNNLLYPMPQAEGRPAAHWPPGGGAGRKFVEDMVVGEIGHVARWELCSYRDATGIVVEVSGTAAVIVGSTIIGRPDCVKLTRTADGVTVDGVTADSFNDTGPIPTVRRPLRVTFLKSPEPGQEKAT
jgi:hypothetical protein